MLRKNRNTWTCALLMAFVLAGTAVPATAAGPSTRRAGEAPGWQGAWSRVLVWMEEVCSAIVGPGGPTANVTAADSPGIDPNGQPNGTPSDSSAGVDPDGTPNVTPSDYSAGIDPNG